MKPVSPTAPPTEKDHSKGDTVIPSTPRIHSYATETKPKRQLGSHNTQ